MRMTMLWRSSAHGSYGQRLQHLPGNLPSSTPPRLGDQLNTSHASAPIQLWVRPGKDGELGDFRRDIMIHEKHRVVWEWEMYGNVYSHFAHISRWLQRARIPKSCPPRISQRWIHATPIAAFVWQPQHAWAKQCMVKQSGRLGTASSYMGVQTDPISADMAGCVQFLAIRIVLHVPEAYYEGRVFQAVGQALQIVHVVLAQCSKAFYSDLFCQWIIKYINQPPSQSAHNPTQSHITPHNPM